MTKANEMCRALAASTVVEYDCQRCGACCLPATTPGEDYVLLEAEDVARLRPLALPIITNPNGVPRLGTVPYDGPGGATACSAFSGAPGFPCGCTVYSERPLRCREFEMGSAVCRSARLRAGLPI